MPSVPTTVLILKFTTPDLSVLNKNFNHESLSQLVTIKLKPIFNPKHLNDSVMWAFIFFDILIWFGFYYYLN
jgi:hypothetical protein